MKIRKSIRLFTVLSVLSPMALSMVSPSAMAQDATTDKLEVKEVRLETELTTADQDATKVVLPPFSLTETEVITNDESESEEDNTVTDSEEVTEEDNTVADSEEVTEEEDNTVADDETTDETVELTAEEKFIEELKETKETLSSEREELIASQIEAKTSLEEATKVVEEFNAKLVLETTEEETALELSPDQLSEVATLKLDITALKINVEEDIIAKIEVVEDETDEVIADEDTDENSEDTNEDNTVVDNSLEVENDELQQVVCEQRDQISDLTSEIEALRAQVTPYEPMMNMMSQLMMMNQMMMMQSMQQPQQPYGYGGNAVDFTGQMMAPMMMMQSMSMGMQVANLSAMSNPFAMANQMTALQAMPQNQNVYNVGGDFYGRDYSMTQPQTMPGASSLMSGSVPQIPYRDFGFGNMITGDRRQTKAPTQTDVVRSPSQDTNTEAEAKVENEKVDTDEMVKS